MTGKRVVAGTRISGKLVVELLAENWSIEDILEQCPALSREDIQACLHYAHEMLQSERVYPVQTSPTS